MTDTEEELIRLAEMFFQRESLNHLQVSLLAKALNSSPIKVVKWLRLVRDTTKNKTMMISIVRENILEAQNKQKSED